MTSGSNSLPCNQRKAGKYYRWEHLRIRGFVLNVLQAYSLPSTILTVILIQNGQAHMRSTAALKIFSLLTMPWYSFLISTTSYPSLTKNTGAYCIVLSLFHSFWEILRTTLLQNTDTKCSANQNFVECHPQKLGYGYTYECFYNYD
jgi:hypothetical protein